MKALRWLRARSDSMGRRCRRTGHGGKLARGAAMARRSEAGSGEEEGRAGSHRVAGVGHD
jgi:hypothetical protein